MSYRGVCFNQCRKTLCKSVMRIRVVDFEPVTWTVYLTKQDISEKGIWCKTVKGMITSNDYAQISTDTQTAAMDLVNSDTVRLNGVKKKKNRNVSTAFSLHHLHHLSFPLLMSCFYHLLNVDLDGNSWGTADPGPTPILLLQTFTRIGQHSKVQFLNGWIMGEWWTHGKKLLPLASQEYFIINS